MGVVELTIRKQDQTAIRCIYYRRRIDCQHCAHIVVGGTTQEVRLHIQSEFVFGSTFQNSEAVIEGHRRIVHRRHRHIRAVVRVRAEIRIFYVDRERRRVRATHRRLIFRRIKYQRLDRRLHRTNRIRPTPRPGARRRFRPVHR